MSTPCRTPTKVEKGKERASLIKALIRAFGPQFMAYGLIAFTVQMLKVVQVSSMIRGTLDGE
jgi:hypothetical protein